MMIDYIVKYQNKYVYASLFKHNMVSLFEKEVELTNLLNSNVFNFNFETPEWPSTSVDTKAAREPYNGSIFKLRENYKSIFPNSYQKES